MKSPISSTWFSRAALVAACAFASVVAPTPSAAANLLANPGFESGGGSYTGWFTFGSGVRLSLPSTDNIYRTGTAASKVFGGFNGCPGSPAFNVGGFGQLFASPVVGSVYTFSGYSYVASVDPMLGTDTCNKNRMLAKLAFFNATSGGSEIAGDEIVIGDGNLVRDQWTPFSVSIPVPVGALRVEALILFLQPGCDAGSVFVDDLSLDTSAGTSEPNLLVNPDFSSPLATGWSSFGNAIRDTRAFTVRSTGGSAKLFSTFVADSPSGLFQSFPATRATGWKLEAWALNTCQENPLTGTNDNYLVARIVFRDSQSNEVGSEQVVLADKNSPLGTWTKHTVLALAPTGTTSVDAFLLFISPTLQGGNIFVDDVLFKQLDPTGVPETPGPPQTLLLQQNVPNPFNPTTRIDFSLSREDVVDLSVYDVTGRRIATLVQGPLAAGSHVATWDGRTATGKAAATGIYRYVLRTSAGQTSRSMSLIK